MDLSNFPLIFMGTPSFSEKILQFLLSHGCSIQAVYTQPPRPQGRGLDVVPSAVQMLAQAYNIPVFTPLTLKSPETQREFLEFVHTHHIQAAIVVAYGLLLPKIILQALPFGCFNVHASLLPRWRGASPIQRTIEAGDSKTGLTLMKMEEGLDTGPILLTTEIFPSKIETSESLFERLSMLGGPLVLKGLQSLCENTLQETPQPLQNITYAPKVLKEEGLLNFSESAFALERKVRAFNPWPGTFFNYNALKIKVLTAQAEECTAQGKIGEIIETSPLKIQCSSHTAFLPSKLQRPGGIPLEADEFLRGFSLPKGTILEGAL